MTALRHHHILNSHNFIQKHNGLHIFRDRTDGQLERYSTNKGGSGAHYRNTRVEFANDGSHATYAEAFRPEGGNRFGVVKSNCYWSNGRGSHWQLVYRDGIADWNEVKKPTLPQHCGYFLEHVELSFSRD